MAYSWSSWSADMNAVNRRVCNRLTSTPKAAVTIVTQASKVTDRERGEVIKKMLASVAVILPKGMDISQLQGSSPGQQGIKSKVTTFLNTDFTAQKKMKETKKKHQVPLTPEGKVILTNEEYRAIEYLLIRDKIDMGVLKPFHSDPYIEDISCDGVGPIFIEHKIFKGLKSVIEFKVSSELDEFVVKVA